MTATAYAPTAADYQAAFELERAQAYPMVDAFESRMGYAVNRARLEEAARVLACPLKKNPPNWQHGRVLYAAASAYLHSTVSRDPVAVDIGTAKGFSALCLLWAITGCPHTMDFTVHSVDVIDPEARIPRNTVAEVDGLKTLAETLQPWWNGTAWDGDDEARHIQFLRMTGVDYLKAGQCFIDIAFVDGSHNAAVVAEEGRLLAKRQRMHALAIFDDADRADIRQAVDSLSDAYKFRVLDVLPNRAYAIGVRR